MLKMASLFERLLQDGLPAVLWLLAAIVAASVLYSLFLLVVAAFAERRLRKSAPIDSPLANPPRFLVLIPAHNEEAVLGAALTALSHVEYPITPRVVVIADNCEDQTAAVAAKHEGVEVLERVDPNVRGKGHALNWALEKLLAERSFDLVAIIDADTQMDPGFLKAMARAYSALPGPGAYFAAQGRYEVLNAADSWRTALMAGALSLVHYVRPLAREELGLSCGLKGNGMCLSASLLARLAWKGDSLTEDIEYALDLAQNHGLAVRFVPGAIVRAEMPVHSKAAGSQRRRWERGRYALMRSRAAGLIGQGIASHNRVALDCAFDLCVPPLAELVVCEVVWGLLLIPAALIGYHAVPWLVGLWAASLAGLAGYVIGGFLVARAPRAAYRALAFAPIYVAWKMMVYAAGRREKGWVRTERAPLPPVPPKPEPVEAVQK